MSWKYSERFEKQTDISCINLVLKKWERERERWFLVVSFLAYNLVSEIRFDRSDWLKLMNKIWNKQKNQQIALFFLNLLFEN